MISYLLIMCTKRTVNSYLTLSSYKVPYIQQEVKHELQSIFMRLDIGPVLIGLFEFIYQHTHLRGYFGELMATTSLNENNLTEMAYF